MKIEKFSMLPEAQRKGLRRVWNHQDNGKTETFPEAIERAAFCFGGYIGIEYNGMFIGIETDGHSHT